MPRILDLYCCAGGAGDGYAAAGFEVVGVDIAPQPNYPHQFVRADAREYLAGLLEEEDCGYFDAIHASPPCQTRTAYKRRGDGVGDGYEDHIAQVQQLLDAIGKPYVIENVPTAPLRDPVVLCGSMFGLDVRRHRLFETNWPLTAPPCNHKAQAPNRFPGATNRAPMSRATVEVGVWRIPLDVQKRAMGIDREITLRELSEALPPVYTEWIGRQMQNQIRRDLVASTSGRRQAG